MKNFYETVVEYLKNKENIILALLIANSGSTPREAGAKMIIRQNGQTIGTIGGGKIEAEVQKQAKEIFKNKKSVIQNYDLTADGIASIGMICGGEASVYIQYLDASDDKNLQTYQRVLEAGRNKKKSWFITKASIDGNEYKQYILEEGSEEKEEVFQKVSAYLNNKKIVHKEDGIQYIIEPLISQSKAYIFGGGHVGHALTPVLSSIGFYTVVIDDREEFSAKERFPSADETITADFENVFNQITIDEKSFIVIVTRGHLNDYDVLVKALKTNARYIGMIGSSKKWAVLQEKMLAEGYSKEDINRVHAPIGLRIKAETPEEIAISIAGEMILVKATDA